MIKRENYISIQGWMLTDLDLKGNELLLYALIYGFSQDGKSKFNGSLQYMAEWTNSSKQGVLGALKKLLEKNYIAKEEYFENNIKFVKYYTTNFNGVLNKVEQGIKQSLMGGIKQSLTNNIDIDNINNKLINNNPDLFFNSDIDKCFSIYKEKCTNLIKLTGYEKKNKETLTLIDEVFEELDRNHEKFEELCVKANELVCIVDKKIDFKMMLRNYIGILNGKYKEPSILDGIIK